MPSFFSLVESDKVVFKQKWKDNNKNILKKKIRLRRLSLKTF